MYSNDFTNRIHQKLIEINGRIKANGPSRPDGRNLRILQSIHGGLGMIYKPSCSLDLELTRQSRSELVRLVDDAVVRDPVGSKLYEFGWQDKLPSYVNGDWFIAGAREDWNRLGKTGKTDFKRRYMMVSDSETWDFLDKASEEELFGFYVHTQAIYEEKQKAFDALFRMAGRSMKKSEYKEWAGKFGIKLTEDFYVGYSSVPF